MSTPTAVPYRLEVVTVPVADFERAKSFYVDQLGWRNDGELDGPNGYQLMQVTPPGSEASVIFGSGVTEAPPGSVDGLLLAVSDIDQAVAELAAKGVEVSEVFHDRNGQLGGGLHADADNRAGGRDPENRSYGTYASFPDPDGNRWVLQELTERQPGRLWPSA